MPTRVTGPLRLLLALALAVPLASACSSGGGEAAPAGGPAPPIVNPGPLHGPLVVFASVPLKETLEDVQNKLAQSDPSLTLNQTFAGTPQLAQQLDKKVPADVLASADQETMQKLVAANLIATPAIFARNKLQIAVAKGNPKGVKTLTDLTRPGIKLALVDAGQPLGRDARRAFDNALLTVTPTTPAPVDAKDALLAVTTAKADATLVYVTDVAAAEGTVAGVAIPDAQNVVAAYRIAVVKDTKNADGAKAYVDYVVNGDGQQLMKAHGFLPP